MIAQELKHWLPYKLLQRHDGLQCQWLFAGEKRFTEPFFDETVLKCLSHPFNSKPFKAVSNVDLMVQWSAQMECLQPSVIIFHISRCGSTLLAQLLSEAQQNTVLSEVPFLDALLRLPYGNKNVLPCEAESWFEAALRFYGHKRLDGQRLFLKMDSWHILFYKQLRKLYPGVPFVLLYRKPDEVICSHQKNRGMHAVPGLIEPAIFGWSSKEIGSLTLDVYLSQVLEKYFEAYLHISASDNNIILADYREGILAILDRIRRKANLPVSESDWQNMKDRAGYDAKQPNRKFSAGAETPANAGYLQNCFRLYDALEAIRTKDRNHIPVLAGG